MKRIPLITCAAALSLGLAGSAQAALLVSSAPVTSSTVDNYAAPNSGSYFSTAGSQTGQYASPFSDTTSTYGVVQNGFAQYDFGTQFSKLSLVFGSPDSYNTISFLNGTSLVDTFDVATSGLSSLNNYVVTISANPFTSVQFGSSQAAFEFSNVQALSPVPLPPALPMFGAALLVVGGLGWRKRKADRFSASALSAA